MKKKEEKNTGLVRTEEKVIRLVKNHVKTTKQTVGGFFALAAIEKIDRDKTN